MLSEKIFSGKHFLLTILFLLCISLVYGQETKPPVIERSKEKVIIGGKIYYLHTVKEKETLFSISRAYDLTQQEIEKENPGVLIQLNVGQMLKIPYKEPGGKVDSKDREHFYYHVIQKGDTYYSLSKRYNVSQDIIRLNNPRFSETDLPLDEEIKIPKPKIDLPRVEFTQKDEDTEDYYVKRGERLDDILLKFDISLRELKMINPELHGTVETGQRIKIPRQKMAQMNETGYTEDANPIYLDFSAYNDPDGKFSDNTYNVAVLLPFFLEKNQERYYTDSSEVNNYGNKVYKKVDRGEDYIYPPSLNFIQFYQGLLMAADTLKTAGANLNFYAYDTGADTNKVKKIIQKPEMKQMDLIIGPAYSKNVEIVSAFAENFRVGLVSPLSTRTKMLDSNPFMFQVKPSLTTEFEQAASFVSQFPDKNIVLVHEADSLFIHELDELREKIYWAFWEKNLLSDVVIKEVVFKDSIYKLEHALSRGIENIVIAPSRREGFVMRITAHLNTLRSRGYESTLVGYPYWETFQNVELENLFRLKLHVFSPNFVDYKNAGVKNFIHKYRKSWMAEPTEFSFLGYDIGMYFLNAVGRYGKVFPYFLDRMDVSFLQTVQRYERVNYFGGFENHAFYKIYYNLNDYLKEADYLQINELDF